MIPDFIINQIQGRADIVDIISGYVPLKRAGRNFKAPCPFHHEKSPSFIVSPDKQIYHCFGCGAGGNVFNFLMKHEKRDFREAVEMLAERVGIEIPKDKAVDPAQAERMALFAKANDLVMAWYHHFLLTNPEAEKARAYLKIRGVSDQTIVNFKLGYASESWDGLYRALHGTIPDPVLEKMGLVIARKDGGFYDRFRHRVIFPILDSKGGCIAFGGRVMDDSQPKYLNSPDSEIYSKGRNLYGLYHARKAIRECDSVIVVEGYMDFIACHQAGVENVVASLGTALTMDQVRLIKRHTQNIFILYDADPAGEMATSRGLELCLEEGLEVKIVRLSDGYDPDSFLREFGAEPFRAELSQAKTLFDYKLAFLKKHFDARSLEGKVKIANEMVLLFSKVQNEILRSAWTDELAKVLSLSTDALRREMMKLGDAQRSIRPAPPLAAVSSVSSVERLMIGLILDDTEFAARAKEEVDPEDFQHVKAREIAKRILDAKGGRVVAATLMNFYKEDAEILHILSHACAEIDTLVDRKKTLEDCIVWMKRSRIKNERDNLQSQILAAQQEGDKNRISKLLYDFNELNRGIKKINERK